MAEESDVQGTKWHSRKYWTMVAVVVGSTILLLTDSITEATWQQVLGFTVIPYFAANVAQHVWSKK